MNNGIVLSIDQGTSGTKAIVADGAGRVLSLAEQSIHPSYLPGGGVEQDPMELLNSVLGTGRRAVAESGATIDAVALANQGETVLAWDRATGRPLSPAIVWQDRRSEQICIDRAEHATLVADRSGLVLDPYFSAPKLRWLRDHVTSEGVVTTTDTWLVHQLCGAFVTDTSTASRSALMNLDTQQWDDVLIDVFDLGNETLPDLVASDAIVGTTTIFGPEVPVTGLMVDQQAALLAESCLAPGTAKCTYGTGAFLLAQVGSRSIRSEHGLTTSVGWTLADDTSFCIDGQVYTAASAVRWITDLGLISGADQLDEIAATSSEGVLCVPALAGLGSPWWDATATATWRGMTLSTTRAHLVRSLLEGIAAQVAGLMRAVGDDMGAPLTRLRVDGGLTRSRVLMQAQADLSQLPVDIYPSQHATPLGAAAAARMALTPSLSVEDAVGTWRPSETYEPRWPSDQALDHLARWEGAAQQSLGDQPGKETT